MGSKRHGKHSSSFKAQKTKFVFSKKITASLVSELYPDAREKKFRFPISREFVDFLRHPSCANSMPIESLAALAENVVKAGLESNELVARIIGNAFCKEMAKNRDSSFFAIK
jgi:hypothetical protein